MRAQLVVGLMSLVSDGFGNGHVIQLWPQLMTQ